MSQPLIILRNYHKCEEYSMTTNSERRMMKTGIYMRGFKRILDIICALMTLIVFCWLYGLLAILVRVRLGSPVIFRQPRPGKIGRDGRERIFYLYKFRTMTDERDERGRLLPDEVRLTPFGKKLRDRSLDELPQAWNILKGDMSLIGPRPLLVRDMVFMTKEQRSRHSVRPGLTGLAQVNGRNAISWENKLAMDVEYTRRVTFINDLKIILKTVVVVLKKKDINQKDTATTDDFGDYLLKEGKIDRSCYDAKQEEALAILDEWAKN